jgi:ArsR family transcriptional regulator
MTKLLEYERYAEIYKVLANTKRLVILHVLDGKEFSVDELTKRLKIRKPNISQHLAVLRHAKLVVMRKHGTKVYYKIADSSILKSCEIIQALSKKHKHF